MRYPMNRTTFEGLLVTQDITEEQKEVIRTAKLHDHDIESRIVHDYCPCVYCADSAVEIKKVTGIEDGQEWAMFDLVGDRTNRVVASVSTLQEAENWINY